MNRQFLTLHTRWLLQIKTIALFICILKLTLNCVLRRTILFGATKNMRRNVLIRIDKQAAFPADTFPFVFYILYHRMFILIAIWANDCPRLLRSDFSLYLQWAERGAPQQAAPANRAHIAQRKSYKMAQAIFEVLEGRNNLLITT